MEESKLIQIIKSNPSIIATIDDPTEEMKLLAVKKSGLVLEYIKNPTIEIQEAAIDNNARAIKYIGSPTEDMMIKAVNKGWSILEYIKNPTDQVIELAIDKSGWAIQYVKNPSEELQLLAVRKNYDSIKYIKEPCERVQEEAVNISYDALRYIKTPSSHAELTAIRNNEAAINFVTGVDKDKILKFLKVNILVIKYVVNKISKDELEEVLKQVLSSEDVEEKYVRDFLNCSTIDKANDTITMDKIMFIYKYGSKKAKRIAVDEKLKMI